MGNQALVGMLAPPVDTSAVNQKEAGTACTRLEGIRVESAGKDEDKAYIAEGK